ncbi:hypothetical protein JM16_008581 [Phytophthora kernoviae]|uniref:UFSP1/2/DUB catalytic domain-containing protein n=1 Tax=Phytophthora kernoviae TaxID=325452 RepID=A0A8T0LLX8_9STRA|nr:hypothetical protein JM16_008581 [Phytophthora kernoviae]
MAEEGAIPAALLRSLHRFSASNESSSLPNTQENPLPCSILARGSILGVYNSSKSVENDIPVSPRLVIFGLLQQPPDAQNPHNFAQYLPNGITRVGSFVVVRGDASEGVEDLAEAVALQVAAVGEKKEKVLVYEVTTETSRLYGCEGGKATSIHLEVVQSLHARDFLRTVGFAPLLCAVDFHVVGKKETLIRQLKRYETATKEDSNFYVRVGVTSSSKGKKSSAFRVVNGCGEDIMSPDAKSVMLESILPEIEEEVDDAGSKSKKKNGKKQKKSPGKKVVTQQTEQGETATRYLSSLEYGDIANVDLLVSLAPMNASAEVAAPVLTIPPPSNVKPISRHFHAHCDALVMVSVDSSLQTALSLLRQQLYQQLKEIAKRLEDAPEAVVSVVAHQFPLVGAAFPLTLVSDSTNADYNNDESMDDVALLESLHRAFFQPLQQSLFRVSRGCSLAQQGEWLATSDVLYNVHEGIPSSGVSAQGQQGKLALVGGFYGYYHYMQQRVNDKGWGCAYRSLQTLASWLFVQHYTQQKFLSHEHIQRALVQMGDKPSRFQGSTEWIGSLEVGYVLDELFGVTFRSLSVSSGDQLASIARELLDHFETQGTPVMMGGGQLAFTLLGVDYDPDSGACAFLTLDPHYTGDEDITTIQQQLVQLEGYKAVPCSWRKTTSFTKKSFYNLCLPQRPSVGV